MLGPLERYVVGKLVEKVKDLPVERIVLFGSRARGVFCSESDVDIALFYEVERKGEVSVEDPVLDVLFEEGLLDKVAINHVRLFKGEKSGLRDNVERDGKLLWKRSEAIPYRS